MSVYNKWQTIWTVTLEYLVKEFKSSAQPGMFPCFTTRVMSLPTGHINATVDCKCFTFRSLVFCAECWFAYSYPRGWQQQHHLAHHQIYSAERAVYPLSASNRQAGADCWINSTAVQRSAAVSDLLGIHFHQPTHIRKTTVLLRMLSF